MRANACGYTPTTTTTTPPDRAPAVLSVAPVTLPAPGRAVDLRVRVSAPLTGTGLPVVLLSHGNGPSNHLSSFDGLAGVDQLSKLLLLFIRVAVVRLSCRARGT